MQSVYCLASLLALLGTVASEALPYNPTRILLSPNATYAYIFQPSADDGQSALLQVDYANTLTTSDTGNLTLFDTLPFLYADETIPYTPMIDADGNFTVVAGNCTQGANGTQVWRSTAASGSTYSDWAQLKTTDAGLGSSSADAGAKFLAGGVAFSQDVDATAETTAIFVFGGMCPFANSTTDTWISSANYSNTMVMVSSDSSTDYVEYEITVATSSGPPIAEAGFSITPLDPTYSVDSSGTVDEQEQDFVLLGGHTDDAFINMSQVALYSLPQESWSFLPVIQPSEAKTDLATKRSTSEVEPRSGHTAVLTEDGNSVVLFGGWVGDTGTPAQPQLAILEFGSGYGGAGDWTWSIPSTSGSGLASGAGIYGHGAAMLPGGVMFVTGGYAIPSSSSKFRKRDAQTASTQTYFYNVSSQTWLDQYDPPASLTETTEDSTDASGPLSTKSEKAGLGAGLGIGAAILVSLVVFYFWYTRRLKKAREARGRALLSRSSDGSFGGLLEDATTTRNGGIDGRGGDAAGVGRFWNVRDQNTGTYPARAPEMEQSIAAGSTGLFVSVPSPTRGLRKGVAGKNYQYHAAPRYDDSRMSRTSGNIHPIAEREEEDEQMMDRGESEELSEAERKLRELERVLNSPDPFLDGEPNPLGSHPVSPELGDVTVKRVSTGASRVAPQRTLSDALRAETPNWTVVPENSEPLLVVDTGRVSPSKTDERTSSTLSERSQTSITRTMSTRTGAMLAAAMARALNSSPENSSSSDGRTHTMSTSATSDGRKSPFYYHTRARSSTAGSAQMGAPNSAGTDADSFTTARTNFAELQTEGESLLGGRPALDRDDPYQRALAAHSSTRVSKAPVLYDDYGPAPAIPPRRRQGWMGSLRRAINAVSMSERSFSLTGTLEQYSDEPYTSASSPTKYRPRRGGAPRRTVSDGGALLKHKRGKSDWEDNQWPRYRDDPDPGDWGEPLKSPEEKQAAEEEWDVEGAASKRDVQVMFTIPKSRLRVVNADMDRASLRSASEGALSRANSVREVRPQESIRTLRTRSEGDRMMLSATAEEERGESIDGAGYDDHLPGASGKDKAA